MCTWKRAKEKTSNLEPHFKYLLLEFHINGELICSSMISASATLSISFIFSLSLSCYILRALSNTFDIIEISQNYYYSWTGTHYNIIYVRWFYMSTLMWRCKILINFGFRRIILMIFVFACNVYVVCLLFSSFYPFSPLSPLFLNFFNNSHIWPLILMCLRLQ